MPRTHFLNVDLDVHSDGPLTTLARAMESLGACTLHCGRWDGGGYRASFEAGGVARNAERTIRSLARMVRSLPPPALHIWENATARDLNIGLQAGTAPFSHESTLSPKTIAIVSELRCRLVFTVYAAEVVSCR